jgi:hypothetical protein
MIFRITQLAIAEMEKQGSGHVVQITMSLADSAIAGMPAVLAPGHRRDQRQSRPYRSLGVILMGMGIAEVHEDAIAQIFRYKPVKATHRSDDAFLISGNDLSQILRVHAGAWRDCVHSDSALGILNCQRFRRGIEAALRERRCPSNDSSGSGNREHGRLRTSMTQHVRR